MVTFLVIWTDNNVKIVDEDGALQNFIFAESKIVASHVIWTDINVKIVDEDRASQNLIVAA